MVVRAGREFLAIPGPTTMPDEVLRAMHRPALDIYSDQMVELTDSLLRDLSRLFATTGHSYIYIANGHGAWEAALSNVLSRGDKVLVLESGRFAIGWGNAAAAMGADVEVLKGDWRRAVRPAEVEARLRQDKDHAHQGDPGGAGRHRLGRRSTTSRRSARRSRRAGHPALFMVDTVASLGCMPFEMDAWGIDVAMSGSQKGLMSPPGLGFVAANDRARAGAQERRTAHALLGLDRARRPRALPQICRHRADSSVVRAAPGHRHAVRRRSSTTCSCAIACSPKRCAARSRSGPKARCSASTSPNPANAPTPSPP